MGEVPNALAEEVPAQLSSTENAQSKLVRHASAYFIARALPGIINFVAVGVYTRLLAPKDYGPYTLAWAGVCLCDALLFQWLRVAMWRFLPLYEGRDPQRLLSMVVSIFLGIAGVTSVLGGVAIFLWPEPGWTPLLTVSLALLWSNAWLELNLTLSNARIEPFRYGLFAAIRSVVGLLTGVSLVAAGYSSTGPVVGLLAGSVVAGVWMSADRWPKIWPLTVDRSVLSDLVRYGAPFSATFALSFVLHLADRFIIGAWAGRSAVGLYAAGFDLAQQSIGMLMTTVNLAGYPLAARALESTGAEAARRQLNENGNLLLAVALPSAVSLVVFASELSELVLGARFRETGAMLIPIISVAALFGGCKVFYADLAFQLGRRTTGQLHAAALAAGVSLTLNTFLIPRLGVMGAAVSNLIAQTVALAASILFGRRVWPLPLPSEFLRVSAAAGILALTTLLLRKCGVRNFALLLSGAVLAYFAAAYVLRISAVRDGLVRRNRTN